MAPPRFGFVILFSLLLAVSASAQAPRKWRLSQDLAAAPAQANPNPDRYGNPGVWHYLGDTSPTHDPTGFYLLPTYHENPALPGWMDALGAFQDSPFMLVNRSARALNFGTFSWPVGLAGLSPLDGRAAVVGWRSPFTGTVHVRGFIEDFEKQARGNGVRWLVKKGTATLAHGTIGIGEAQTFQQGILLDDLRAVSVASGEFLYFIVDANGDEDFDVTRLDVDIDEVIVPLATLLAGSAPSSREALGQGAYDAVNEGADPVHLVFGTFTTQVTDLRIGGARSIGGLTRTYSTALPEDGPLGWGWTLSYDLRVRVASADALEVRRGDGRVDRFVDQGGGMFVGPAGLGDTLVDNGNGFTLTTRDRIVYTFNAAGRLLTATDRSGNVVQLTYDVAGRWTGISEPSGRVWTFTYGKNGRIASITDPAKRAVKFAYNAAGDLVSVTNPLKGKTVYAYDSEHRLTSITDARKVVVLQNSYDAAGRVVTQVDPRGTHSLDYQVGQTIYTDPAGGEWTTAFDGQYRVTSRTNPLGGSVSFGYNAAGLVTSETDARGKTTLHTYDASGRRSTITDALLGVTTFTYDVQGNLKTVTDPLNHTTTYGYDGLNRLTSITDAANGLTQFAYNAAGLITSTTDPNGGVTVFSYDTAGNRVSVRDPLLKTTTFQYDAAGNLIAQTDPLGRVTKLTYDKLGRLTSRTGANRAKVKFTYDAVGHVTKETDALSRSTLHSYNGAGDLVSTKNPLKGVTKYEYDALGRVTKTISPMGATTTFLYDAAGRRTRETNPLGHATNFSYDANDNLSKVTDALSHETAYTYDDLNRVVTITDPNGGQNTFTYDAVGNRKTTKDARNNTTTFAYDVLNRLVSETNALGHARSFTYDAVGRLATRTNGEGQTITYDYDLAGRLTSVSDGTDTTTYTYDDVGNRLTMTDSLGTTNYAYDMVNRLTLVEGTQGILTYTYDKHGNRTKVRVGEVQNTYTYDKLNRVGSVRRGAVKVSYLYDADGRNTAEVFSNKVKTVRQYDAAGRPVSIVTSGGKPVAELFRATYTYDSLGRRLSETGADFTAAYTYDPLNRLTAATVTTGPTLRNFAYAYDAAGNRLTANEDGFLKTYTYDAANRIATFNGTPYTYDNDGRLTADHAGTFTYDAFGRLKTAGLSSYEYDGDGNNVTETRNGTTTRYVIDTTAPLPLRVSEVRGGVIAFNLYGVSLAAQIEEAGDVFFQHTDALGSIRLRTRAAGAVDERLDYAPFGSRLVSLGEGGAFSFTGEPYTNGSLLVNLRARYYSPVHGRFLTTDPVENSQLTQTVNLYTYVANNPVNLSDRSGEEFDLFGAIGRAAQSAWNGLVQIVTGGNRREPVQLTATAPPAPVTITPDIGLANSPAGLVGLNGSGVINGNGSAAVASAGGSLVGLNGSNVINGNGSTAVAGAGGSLVGLNGSNVINGNGSTAVANAGGSLVGLNGSNVINGNGSTAVANLSYSALAVRGKPTGAMPFDAGNTDQRKAELILKALGSFFGGSFAGGN